MEEINEEVISDLKRLYGSRLNNENEIYLFLIRYLELNYLKKDKVFYRYTRYIDNIVAYLEHTYEQNADNRCINTLMKIDDRLGGSKKSKYIALFKMKTGLL
jgi:hypothetical protein